MRVRARDVARSCELRHETSLLTCAFQQSVLPGCVLERGLTCSRGELRALLRRTVSGLAWGQGRGEVMQQSGLSRPWEHLHVRVEHNHRSDPRIEGLEYYERSHLFPLWAESGLVAVEW